MNAQGLIRQYLSEKHIMQLATATGDQPWVCSVWFVADDEMNLYWASWPSRRHSKELLDNNKVSAAIVIQDAKGTKGIGIQIEGQASQIQNYDLIKPIAVLYAQKFDRTPNWIEKISNQQTEHRLYKLEPRRFVLFDEEHFPPNIGQEFMPT